METMEAAGITAPGGLDKLAYEAVPRPQPGADEVLVRVHAAAITPTELSWSGTWKTRAGADRPFPIILGHELAGVVVALGPTVTDLAVGQAVYGFNDWDRQGAQAAYCLARQAQLAPKPHSLDFVQAAEAPISALTAWHALFDHAHLSSGQRVPVHGTPGRGGAS